MAKKRGLQKGDDVCWATGYADFYHGYTKEQCPYIEPRETNNWKNGWECAERESNTTRR